MESTLTKKQTRQYGPKIYIENGVRHKIFATVRYDDDCNNGHNTFSITGEIDTQSRNGHWRWGAGGCLHDEIAKHFPELAPYIKWHLCDSTGPMHYIANTCFHASNRDHNGLLKSEKRQLRNGRSKKPVWQRVVRNHKGEECELSGHHWIDSESKPVEVMTCEWEPVWIIGEGKERDLSAARKCAVWPEATDEQLMLPKEELAKLLEARLPALLVEFRKAVESLEMNW